MFKIHANMDPNHRSCIAFVKVCSGRFERNANYKHVRSGKNMRFAAPTAFMAQKKSVVDEAFPGDIVGIPDTGIKDFQASRPKCSNISRTPTQ